MSDKKLTVLDFVKDISQYKKGILDDDTQKYYKPFVVNKYLSMDATTVLYAAEVNQRPYMPKDMQYDYYMNAIDKRSRFFKYVKETNDDNLSIVKEYFGYGKKKAKEALSILTDDDIEYMKKRLSKGGHSAKSKR
jgi:hypothetical protein